MVIIHCLRVPFQTSHKGQGGKIVCQVLSDQKKQLVVYIVCMSHQLGEWYSWACQVQTGIPCTVLWFPVFSNCSRLVHCKNSTQSSNQWGELIIISTVQYILIFNLYSFWFSIQYCKPHNIWSSKFRQSCGPSFMESRDSIMFHIMIKTNKFVNLYKKP